MSTSSRLPQDPPAFGGIVNELATESTPERPEIARAPSGAPNVVVVMFDDVGFGAPSTFGGPVDTPALDRIAQRGLRYNQFHTTALCSPTRAALLTGRNHHRAHMGGIGEIAYGFPGYDGIIPRSTATIAETLRLNGYGTGMFGKAHFTPMWETTPAGPFDRWPTGLGFDRFYGFLGGETSQWEPALYDQTIPVQPHLGRDRYHLTEDLADQAIRWMRQQQVSAPDSPFFLYFSPGATHTPFHVWPEYIDKYAGRFDQGWDVLREEIHQRQLELGVIPEGTALTPRPEEVPAWEDYPERYRPVAARLMETYAGFLEHTDEQVGRLIAELESLGIFEDTLFVYLTGDNGASAEGTVHGSFAAPAFQNGEPEDPEWLLERKADFGSPDAECHFNVAWAWALDSPFQWMKQVASHFGGTRNGMAVSWPSRISDTGGLRTQFHHVIDLAPTILEAAGIAEPTVVHGVEQQPMDGVDMGYTFDEKAADPEAVPSTRRTQYFEILGNRAIYHDGWMACCFHGRLPWVRSQAKPFGDAEHWELYHIAADFSQSVDLAAEHPDKLAELQQLFDAEARRNDVYPLSDQTLVRSMPHNRPSHLEGRSRFTLYPDNTRMPELAAPNLKNCSFRIDAHLTIPAPGARGVVICQGGKFAGWSLYFDEHGRPSYHYNKYDRLHTTIAAPDPVEAGEVLLTADFDYDGGIGAGGTLQLAIDGEQVAEGRLEQTVPFLFSMSGETMDVGVDTGTPVGRYPHQFPFTGGIARVEVAVLSQLTPEDLMAFVRGQATAASTQH